MSDHFILGFYTRTPQSGPFFDYKGWRFTAPFYCMRCGVEVETQQWAFSRSCGGCDVSESHTARLSIFDRRLFSGPHELINPKDSSFLLPDRFLPPEYAKNFPVLNPPERFDTVWEFMKESKK
jgi:hypothetical protein